MGMAGAAAPAAPLKPWCTVLSRDWSSKGAGATEDAALSRERTSLPEAQANNKVAKSITVTIRNFDIMRTLLLYPITNKTRLAQKKFPYMEG